MRKKLAYLVIGLAFLMATPTAFAQDDDDRGGFGINFRWEMLGFNEVGLGPIGFSNIPQSLRTVPSNSAGPLYPAGTPVVIPGSTFSIGDPKFIGFSAISLAPQYEAWRFTFRGGVSIATPNFPAQNLPTAEGGPYQEINQFGTSQRGTGTSLVYYSAYWSKDNPIKPKPFGEIEFRVAGPLSLIGGYGGFQKTVNVALENGYDQYDALTPYSKVTIASAVIKAYGPYGSAKLRFGHYGGVFIKVMQTTASFSSSYPGLTLNTADLKQGVEILFGFDLNLVRIIKH
jgi:hypothetical protein